MKKTIWKFPLFAGDYQQIEMPVGAVVLHAHMNQGQPCIWALVDPDAPKEYRGFFIHGTGHTVDSRVGRYIGTVHMNVSPLDSAISLFQPVLVFHIFEEARDADV